MPLLHSLRQKLRSSPSEQENNPFPVQQLFILAVCRICEPIAFMSIFPYIYYMIKSFDIASQDKQIAIYAGMVTSAFALAEFSTSVIWGRLSDRVGRKPVLLGGLAGTGLSMCVFGFARSFPLALVARALGGLLNGNIGVLQTTVAEVVPVKEHQPRAFAIMPFVWCLGSIIGSGLGGCLAEPVTNYPGMFSRGTILEEYPFLLPNLVSTVVVLFGLVIGVLFLEETHEHKKHQRDYGLELGRWLLAKCRFSPTDEFQYSKLGDATLDEATSLMQDDDLPPDYQSVDASPRLPAKLCDNDTTPPEQPLDPELPATDAVPKPAAAGSAFTKQVMLNVFAYGILAYHTIGFEQLLPVLLSMDESSEAPRSPLKFIGGFGLSSSTIGIILSLQGVYQMVAQMIIFPAVVHRIGPLKTFRFAAFTYPLLYLLVPYLSLLPRSLRGPGLFFVLVWKVTHQALAYPSNMLLLNDAAPSLLVLGVVNGVAASAASLSRAIGPTLAGLIQSAGLDRGYLGMAWWASGAVALIGAFECLWMRQSSRDEAREARSTPQAVGSADESDEHGPSNLRRKPRPDPGVSQRRA